MSRLYVTTKTDIRKGTGNRGHEKISAQINWGSVGDSKRAAEISVYWPKDSEVPEVSVRVGERENLIPKENVDFHSFSPLPENTKG